DHSICFLSFSFQFLPPLLALHSFPTRRSSDLEHVSSGCSYHQAYLLATLDSLKENTELLDVATSLLAAIATNREVLNLWREEYRFLNDQLSKEDYKQEYSLLVKSVCDGLWFAKLFDFGHIDSDDEQKIIGHLLDLLEEDQL